MRRTKILATLGPVSWDAAGIGRLLDAGADAFRLNFSHGTDEEHRALLRRVHAQGRRAGREPTIVADLQGPKIRIGDLREPQYRLTDGSTWVLDTRGEVGDDRRASVTFPDLGRAARAGDPLLIGDGTIELVVESVEDGALVTRVVHGGLLTPHAGLYLPRARLRTEILGPKDRADLALALEEGVDFLALSFVRDERDVLGVRRRLRARPGGDVVGLIAKIERAEALRNIHGILDASDGIMVARGDLGVECAPEDVPLMQKRAIRAANRFGKPVITATQMLETMISQPVATRAEASDVANAILDGSDAVMLSAETAAGRYPVQAVRFMARLCERVEESFPYGRKPPGEHPIDTVPEAISSATVEIAQQLGARAIVTATQSGYTTRMVARHRPQARIVAATPDERAARATLLVWGAEPLLVAPGKSGDEVATQAIDAALRSGIVGEGDVLVYTAGVPVGVPGTTNLIRVHTVGNVALRGHGIGDGRASGRVVRVTRAGDTARIAAGSVVVAHHTDASMVEAISQAAAVVVEEGGLTSHAAIVGLSLGVPVIVGASGALGILQEGESVTVDAARSLVYRGILAVG